MLLLACTEIRGQERKKKITVENDANVAEVMKAAEKVFETEGLGKAVRLEAFDTDFGEYVDADDSTVFKEKGKVRVVFPVTSEAQDGEKDKLISQLKNRLQHLENNMKVVNAKAFSGPGSETALSQRSATSDVRRLKAEAKHQPASPQVERMRTSTMNDDEALLQSREAAREEKKRLKRQEFTAEMAI
eukprot:TRINITY_DN3583_c2_g2_i3.p1 TRINITY_DN3583_c2_g2~~TRINITY_DN3583_c2_g2_i3.p1  ORF type:complete len:188 (+),score=63.50 TRINITY_DN3583_c2_g2_i3:61-624(+)